MKMFEINADLKHFLPIIHKSGHFQFTIKAKTKPRWVHKCDHLDKPYRPQHHTLPGARNFDVSLNTSDLSSGTIKINYYDISNAAIHLYTGNTGYNNTALFKKKPPECPDQVV